MLKLEYEIMLKAGFEFCPVCSGQLTVHHRTGCEFVAAVLAEREACQLIASAVEQKAAELIKTHALDSDQFYYKGRGLAAAQIIKRIKDRGKS